MATMRKIEQLGVQSMQRNFPLLALVGGRLLDPATGYDEEGILLIKEGRIEAWGDGVSLPESSDILSIDCRGLCLSPGLVDMRACICEPFDEHRETIASCAHAAVAGGITTVLCMGSGSFGIESVELVGFVQRRVRAAKAAKMYPCATLTRHAHGEDINNIGLLMEEGALAFCDGWRYVRDSHIMRQALCYGRYFDALIMHHTQDVSLSRGGVMNEGALATRLGLEGITPLAETIGLVRDIVLLHGEAARYHANHITTARSVDIVSEAKAQGLDITCDTSPPYFMLNEQAVADYRTYARLDPPLRAETDRMAMIEGLKRGVIDIIVSDHIPHDRESKRVPFEQAEAGAVGLETMLSLVLHLVHHGAMRLLDALKKVTWAPAQRLGLEAGAFKEGGAADITIFDMNRSWRVHADAFVSKSHNTPFDGMVLQGRAVMTIVDGRIVYTLHGDGCRHSH